MGFGHLDFETGKWIDDPEEEEKDVSPPDERAVDVGGDGLVRPSDAPAGIAAPASPDAGMRAIDVGDDGLARPAAPPLSVVDKAKLIRFIQSGQGSPADIAAARQMLQRSP